MLRLLRTGGRARRPVAFFVTESGSHDDFKKVSKKPPTDLNDAEAVQSLIAQTVKENPVIVYMKGTPQQPMCGFSMQAVRVLNALGVDFSSVNVLENPEIREGVKKFSDWPTIPQLFVDGEFVGGADIMTAQFKNGELKALLKSKKILVE